MTSSRLQDVSLYELALSSEQPPHPLQISPTTLKSMMTAFFDLLIDHRLAATLWLKLPRGTVWQSELDRYRKQAVAPYSLYLLQTQRDDGSDKSDVAGLPLDHQSAQPSADRSRESDLIDDQGVIVRDKVDSQTLMLSLPPDSQLRREYFVVVLCPQFCGMVLAHRPRSVRPRLESTMLQEGVIPKNTFMAEDDPERKQSLLGIYSFEPATIRRILTGIHQAIGSSQTQQPIPHPESQLLAQWESLVSPLDTVRFNPILFGHLFTRQVQHQEEIWHNSAIFRKQAEVASVLQMDNEELTNAIRLKDEFLKNVGQELRTPLTTMKTALTLLNSPNLRPAQRQKYMDMLSQECDRQSALITSVLDLLQLEGTAAEQLPTQPLRLADVVPGVVSTYQPLAQEKGVMLAYTISEDLPAVSCLASWLRQIVINLLHNGIKFTPQGGRVWVRAKQQGDYIQIEFQDTGIGIAPADIPKIFDRFYRVRTGSSDDSGSSGLGLSIVQQLLLRCGGSISVKSKLSEGTVFTVLLPLYLQE